jgi:hypothetical protein
MFVTRDSVPTLSTLQLLAMLALFLLPGVTYAAWELDRRAVRERGPRIDDDDSMLEANGLFEMPGGVELAEESARQDGRRGGRASAAGRQEEGEARPDSHRRRRHAAKHDAGSR